MPYNSIKDAPKALITAGLSLSQINDWSRYYDEAKKSGVEEPGAIAWTIFKKKYKKIGTKWVLIIKGETKMSDDKKDVETITLFQGEGDVAKLKSIIEKLEKAENLSVAKLLVVELKALIPQAEVKVEEKKEDSESKSEEGEVKQDDPAKKPEEKKEEEVEKKEEVSQNSFSEVLKLNGELISQLQEANVHIDTLQKINDKIKNEKSILQKEFDILKSEVTQMQSKQKEVETSRFQKKLDVLIDSYCSFMDIPKEDRNTVRKEMSAFSEDMLDRTLKYIDEKKVTQLQTEADPKTVSSSELHKSDERKVDELKEKYSKMGSKEKVDFIFDRMVGKPLEE